jgi:hypothetical protein
VWETGASRRQHIQRVGSPTIVHTVDEDDFLIVKQAVLNSLRYRTIQYRYDAVAEAHAKAFQWIFDDARLHQRPWDDFTKWLTSQDGIYWISGKAASGKSTLMKYLCSHPDVKRHLASWANNTPVACAQFFFSNTGTTLQKSEAGLLRSLLDQLLSRHLELIPKLLPEVWRILASRSYDFLQDFAPPLARVDFIGASAGAQKLL